MENTQSPRYCRACGQAHQADARFCPYCGFTIAADLEALVAAVPAAASGLNAVSTIMIVLLVLLGLFWLGIGVLQFSLGMSNNPFVDTGVMVASGVWNILISVVNLWAIRGVVRHDHRTVKNLTWLAIIGSLLGISQILLAGAWLQVLVVPLYITLGVLAQANKEQFTELSPREKGPAVGSIPADPNAAAWRYVQQREEQRSSSRRP